MHTNSHCLTFESEAECPQKEQKIIYEREEAYLIRSKPLLVIKTKDKVVCGDLHNHFEFIED